MAKGALVETFDFHPLSYTQPNMSREDYTEFRDDLWKKGLLDPITIFEGKILDGRHRYTACRELKIAIRWEELSKDVDPIDFVESKNARRRNLNPSQRSVAAMRLLVARESAKAVKGKKKAPDGYPDWRSVLPGEWFGETAKRGQAKIVLTEAETKKIAQREDVSPRSLRQAQKVINEGVPELADAVSERKVSVSRAAEIANLPKPKQTQALAAAIDAPRRKPDPPPACPCGGVCPCHRG